MRELTTLKTLEESQRLVAYLALQAVETNLEDDAGEWVVWILRDEDRDKAKEILDEYLANPEDEKYDAAERKVRSVINEAERLQKQRNHAERLRKRWEGSWWHSYPATYIYIALCVLVSVLGTDWSDIQRSQFGMPALCTKKDSPVLTALWIRTPYRYEENNGQKIPEYLTYPGDAAWLMPKSAKWARMRFEATAQTLAYSFQKGEFWRPIGPAFLHFGVLHIFFNMTWIKMVGGAIEYVRGTRRFILLCLIVAVISNVAELFWSGPNFGGASGVVFGLIGYVWMKGRTQPQVGLGLEPRTVVYSIAWLLICMTGSLGAIANAAHLVGFLTGILIGARQAIWKKLPFAK